MLDRETVCVLIKERKNEIQQRYGVTKIGLFGSYVRNEQREDSDIDIVVELNSTNNFRAFFGLKYYLERLLETRVDLGIEHAIKPALRDHILKTIRYV